LEDHPQYPHFHLVPSLTQGLAKTCIMPERSKSIRAHIDASLSLKFMQGMGEPDARPDAVMESLKRSLKFSHTAPTSEPVRRYTKLCVATPG
jgi:hypothetical protein